MKKIITVLVLLAGLSACSGVNVYRPALLSDKNNAMIYIYRPNQTLIDVDLHQPYVYLDDREVSSIGDDRFVRFEAATGPRSIQIFSSWFGMKSGILIRKDVNLEPGKTYYFKMNYMRLATAYSVSTRVTLEPVEPGLAKSELEGMVQDNS